MKTDFALDVFLSCLAGLFGGTGAVVSTVPQRLEQTTAGAHDGSRAPWLSWSMSDHPGTNAIRSSVRQLFGSANRDWGVSVSEP
jgi:hypothetical protein